MHQTPPPHKIDVEMTRIDLNRIASFVRVVEAGSFTAAARQLGLPVSSVSRAIANLESELGVRLLHRTTRKLSLTDGGQHFFQRMQTVVAETEDATRAVTGLASEPRGIVRLTAPPGLGAEQLPRVIGNVVRRYPGVVLQLNLTYRVVDMVGEGIDLAVRAGILGDSSLVARKFAESELAVYGSADYLDKHGRPRRPADLLRHVCLGYGGREGRLPWRLSGPRGHQTIAVTGPIICDDMGFLRQAVIEGLGLGLLPVELVAAAVEDGRLVRVLPRHSYRGGGLFLVWPSRKLVSAAAAAVREMLLVELRALYR
jgi:DNA-binding transcriptional LysR family regulator